MTIYSGQINVTRYKVMRPDTDKKRPVPHATLNKAAAEWKAPPLTALLDEKKGASAREMTAGWVAPEGISAVKEWRNGVDEAGLANRDESSWDLSMGAVNDGIMLRVRIDRRRVPAALVNAVYKHKLGAEETVKGGRRKRLARAERDALKQHVRDTLVSRALPSFTFVDAFWRESAGEMLVFTTSEPALKSFEELFARTFGAAASVSLTRIQPPMTAAPEEFWASSKNGDADVDQWLATLAGTIPASVGVVGLDEMAGA
jgi:hypothetical protein